MKPFLTTWFAVVLCFVLHAQPLHYCQFKSQIPGLYLEQVGFDYNDPVTSWVDPYFHRLRNGYRDNSGILSFRSFTYPDSTFQIFAWVNRDSLVPVKVNAHFDWDQDGVFEASEEIGVNAGMERRVHVSKTITVPNNAQTGGNTRMRIVVSENLPLSEAAPPCGEVILGQAKDYRIVVNTPVTMTYHALQTTTHNGPIYLPNADREMLMGLNVKTKGTDKNLRLKSVTVNMGNSTAATTDLQSLSIHYSAGVDRMYADLSNVGNTSVKNGDLTISTQALPHLLPGDNWFWFSVTMDPNAATPGNFVDLEIKSFTLENNGVSQTIQVPLIQGNPPGEREISSLNYCMQPISNTGKRGSFRMEMITFNQPAYNGLIHEEIEPLTFSKGVVRQLNSYIPPTEICMGSDNINAGSRDHALTIPIFMWIDTENLPTLFFMKAKVDWNQDGDFNDQDELTLLSYRNGSLLPASDFVFGDIVVPDHAKTGYTIVRLETSSDLDEIPCGTGIGESIQFGVRLIRGGDLQRFAGEPTVTGDKDSLHLQLLNAPNNFTFQYSTDFDHWIDYPVPPGKTDFYSPVIDTNMIFRVESRSIGCPLFRLYSNLLFQPFEGIRYVETAKNEICAGDTTDISAHFNWLNLRVTNEELIVSPTDLEWAEVEMEVNNIPYSFMHRYMLDSICFTAATDEQFSAYLQPPGVPAQPGKGYWMENIFKLGEELKVDSIQAMVDHVPGRFCFVNDSLLPKTDGAGLHKQGHYAPFSSWENLRGIDPNGTWKILLYTQNNASVKTVGDAVMHFGTEEQIRWVTADELESPDSAATRVFPSKSKWYTAELTNRYGSFRDSVFVEVLNTEPVAIELIEDQPNDVVCENSTQSFSVNTSEPAYPQTYQWFLNKTPVSGATGISFTPTALKTGDEVKVSYQYAHNCGTFFDADSLKPEIAPVLTPGLTLTPSVPGLLCAHQEVSLQADTANFGAGSTVEWFKNGGAVQSGGLLYAAGALMHNDLIEVKVRGEYPCLSSPELLETYVADRTENVTPEIDIQANQTALCNGEPAAMMALNPVNEGSMPQYQWLLNGTPLPGETGTDLIIPSPADGDELVLQMTSNAPCALPQTIESQPVSLQVFALPDAAFTVSQEPGGFRFTPNVQQGANYAWDFGHGITSNDRAPLMNLPVNNYTVCLEITDANGCVNTSCDEVLVTGILEVAATQKILAFPNPTTGIVRVKWNREAPSSVVLWTTDGRELALKQNTKHAGDHLEFDLSPFADGLYILEIRSRDKMFRSIIRKL